MRTPEQKPRRAFRRRGTAAEGKHVRLRVLFWAVGEDPPDCHGLSVERCRDRYTKPYAVMIALS